MAVGLATVSYSALGIIAGTVFVTDGWRSPSDSTSSLQQSPRIRGLLFFLGTGLIPTVQLLKKADAHGLQVYSLAFVATTFAILILLSWYAYTLSHSRLQDLWPKTMKGRLRHETMHVALRLFFDGVGVFRRDADDILLRRLTLQRDRTMQFLVLAFDGLTRTQREGQRGVDTFVAYIEGAFALCLDYCLEREHMPKRFRASLYYLNSNDRLLYFVAGAGEEPHSRRTFDARPRLSVAGTAIANPGRAIYWPIAPSGQDMRKVITLPGSEINSSYQSIVSYAPQYRSRSVPMTDAIFVLSVDCKDLGDTTYGQYMDKWS